MKCPDKDIITPYIFIAVFIFLYYYSCSFFIRKNKNFLPLPHLKFRNADKHAEQ